MTAKRRSEGEHDPQTEDWHMPANDSTRAHSIGDALGGPSRWSVAFRSQPTAVSLLVASLAAVIALGLGTATLAATTVDSGSSTSQGASSVTEPSDAGANSTTGDAAVTGQPESETPSSPVELVDAIREPASVSDGTLVATAPSSRKGDGSIDASVTADVVADSEEHIRAETQVSVSGPEPIGDDANVFSGAAGLKCGSNSIVMGITCGVLETTGPVGAHAELDADLRPDGR